jgi:glycolate oxidase iron-sulfur subunit
MTSPHWSSPVPGQKIFGPELPDYETLLSCVRCARCLPVCPTYRETLNEIQSPRGRLGLIRAVEDGRLEMSATVEEHLYHCLDCRACNTVCPAGIPIGETIVSARSAIAQKRPRPALPLGILNFFFSDQRRLELVFFFLRIYQMLRLDKLVSLMPLPPSLKAMASMLPKLSRPLRPQVCSGDFSHQAQEATKVTTTQKRVGFFINCVMNVAFAETSAATLRLLQRMGCEVVTPTNLGCCGSPQEDQGARDTMRAFAKRLIAEFERQGELGVIVTDSAGCGSMMKEYGHLLRDDQEWAERAHAFSAKVRDVNEFIAEWVKANPPKNSIKQRVTYHDPCHLLNTQKVKQQPREMLRAIPGIEFVELPEANWCCGSAGVYNITHPAMANKVLQHKLDAIASTQANILVTANPGCLMQIQMGIRQRGLPIQVMHVSEVLDMAYGVKG